MLQLHTDNDRDAGTNIDTATNINTDTKDKVFLMCL